jgi:hypothetical protein
MIAHVQKLHNSYARSSFIHNNVFTPYMAHIL